ncbi:MAG: ABC transporter permease [Rhodospirillales bacterium]|jgi:putative ABC transport system permease protein|nr:ABC transporter permease [Rhodospirillales bacterium]MDP7099258.1 ABC transporter permease [Rhodospirillales bacterium]MDP7215394.1 ABC transporter permease [Rhodospirillales bacterium]HIJ43266.1 ABC transporter permease [Rhodospirillaceae bacterium]HJP55045.1 FtsX-like permease family protein [Rhodospirillales bacterium]
MTGIELAFRLARRELRAGLKGFRVLIACLTLGVAAIAGVGSLSEAVLAGLKADARMLLGGDIALHLHNRSATGKEKAYLRERAAAVSHAVEMRAMAYPLAGQGQRTLVELKGVDEAYPLAGSVLLRPPLSLAEALARDGQSWGAAVDANLLAKLALRLGDEVRVGDARLVLRATIAAEPDRIAGVFSLGPRILVGADALAATGLLLPGSQSHHYSRVRLAPGENAGAWIEDLNRAFPRAGWRIRGVDDAAPGVRRFIERMTLFLTFVGLTALLVGGIGIGNAVKSYLDGKTATIATLKCLGAPAQLVVGIYQLQILAMSLAGIGLGLVLGAGAPALGLWLAAAQLPVTPRIGLYPGALAVAAGFGVLTAFAFALWPLGRARETPATSLFRDLVAPAQIRPRFAVMAATAAAILALTALTVLTATDRAFAYWFVGGTIATMLVLRGGAALLTVAAARWAHRGGAVMRLVLTNIHRPGTPAPSLVLSIGTGLAVLVAVALIEANLNRLIGDRLPATAPAFFFIDIQPHQVPAFDRAVTSVAGTSGFKRVPSLRGRVVGIAGVAVEEAEIAAHAQWAVRGDRALTYAARPPRESLIVEGEWWPADYSGPPLISLDAGIAGGFGVGIGDRLTLNVLGREIEASIANLREIDWRSPRFDFAIIFAPGTLEQAPQTHIATVESPPEAEEAVEKAVADKFSNISIVRVREVLQTAARLLAGIGAAVRAAAAFTLLSGALVLGGIAAAGRRRRVHDAVICKVLGATRRQLLKAYVLEYGLVGLATGLIAVTVGTAIAWAVVVHAMRTEWIFLPAVAAAAATGAIAVTMIAGFAGTWRVLGEKAARHLRNE